MRRALSLAFALLLLLPAGAMARGEDALRRTLQRNLDAAGGQTGGYAIDATARRTLFSVRADEPRILASNTKLFTTAAALDAFGPEARLETVALATSPTDAAGVLSGDLILRGGGDPTFGSGDAEALARGVRAAGVARVTGGVVGDESLFDSQRGTPNWFHNASPAGPLSALVFEQGRDRALLGSPFVNEPALHAAQHFETALEAAGLAVDGAARIGTTPPGASRLAAVSSPTVATLVRLINKPSDNFLAEMLSKGLAAKLAGKGTRAAGALAAIGFARRLGVTVKLFNGSGADHRNLASPREIVELLSDMRRQPTFPHYFDSLTIAGRDGTLETRMRRGPARDRCRGKTGTLDDGVSNLSGYCRTLGGRLVIFSILMNGQSSIDAARLLQNRMTEALVRYRP